MYKKILIRAVLVSFARGVNHSYLLVHYGALRLSNRSGFRKVTCSKGVTQWTSLPTAAIVNNYIKTKLSLRSQKLIEELCTQGPWPGYLGVDTCALIWWHEKYDSSVNLDLMGKLVIERLRVMIESYVFTWLPRKQRNITLYVFSGDGNIGIAQKSV